MSVAKPVRKLNVEVARKIAAGEVIDRPAAIVRELLDNAVDSGASQITVEISGGGIEKIRVLDNGSGMTREDLAACAYPHSTSKIETETDLLNLTTLGFRGEALASIAAVARLCITSGTNKMRASVTENHIIESCASVTGTIVEAAGIFENFPARRRFLKRPAAEFAVCRNIFIEKAMARTDISFRLVSDGKINLDLPKDVSLQKRFIEAAGIRESENLFTTLENTSSLKSDAPDWSFQIVIGEPGVYRSSRKEIFIFVNGRRVSEFSLTQALEYGGQVFFPNGTFPVAALFAQVKPSLVDFNIHPAKKEVRFHDSSALHHAISSTVRTFFHSYTMRTMVLRQNEDQTNGDAENILFELSDLENDIETENLDQGRIIETQKNHNFDTEGVASDARSNFLQNSKSDFSADFQNKTKENQVDEVANDFSENSSRTSFENNSAKKNAYQKIFSPSQSRSARYKISAEGSSGAVSEVSDLAAFALRDDAGRENIYDAKRPQARAAPFQNSGEKIRYIGRAQGTFIIVEIGAVLYLVDQHAAHERILFNRIMANQGRRQNLMVPYVIETDSDKEDAYLEKIAAPLDAAGFTIKKAGEGKWEISAVPERWTLTEAETYRAILDRLTAPEELISKIAAMTACKAAVKDGYVLDDQTAAMLAEAAINLPDPHCPHGRPVFIKLTKDDLFAMVRRTERRR